MREESVARRYAAALLEQAKRSGDVMETAAELKVVADGVRDTPRLRALLYQPLVPQDRKKEAVHELFGSVLRPGVIAFLNLIIDKRRITLLDPIEAEFARLVRDFRNVARASAVSAVPLTDAQTAALERSLEARTGKDIELETAVDPALIGGVLVRIGDTVMDGTVRGNLERLREQLLARR